MVRGPRPLEISAELAAALAGAREQWSVTSEPRVNLDRLQDVEAALAIHFHDDLLALFAAGVSELGAGLERVIGITGELKARKVRGDLVGLGELEDDFFVCVSKGSQRGGQTEVILVDADAEAEAAATESQPDPRRRMSVLELIERLCDRKGDPASFEPVLYRKPPESTLHGRRVIHKIFGEGSLLSEIGTGPTRKCKVDFPGRGMKLLQARFLEFPDD